MTRRGYLRLLAAALAATAMLVAVPAGPPVWAQSGNEAVISRNFPPSMAQSTAAFWTNERMANATPMPMPAPRAVSMRSQPTVTMRQGPAVVASSGLPGDARWEESFPQPATLQEPLWGTYPNFLFSPGRWIGTNPYGTWTVNTAFTLGGWQSGLLEDRSRRAGDEPGWIRAPQEDRGCCRMARVCRQHPPAATLASARLSRGSAGSAIHASGRSVRRRESRDLRRRVCGR